MTSTRDKALKVIEMWDAIPPLPTVYNEEQAASRRALIEKAQRYSDRVVLELAREIVGDNE